ncbi:MAG: phosphatidate cytidylyltransferase, partial [Candidatus Dependentiae bacterium]|nr:phosphatidate cytidylyltransferase [Candidatus Dependentiae bacterium]
MIKFNEATKRFITASIIGTVFWTVFFYLPPIAFSAMLLGILSIILVLEWKNFFNLNSFWFWIIMPWYPILPFILLVHMNGDPCYRSLVYYIFVIVFAFDGTAYITGKLLGAHKIVPHISPGKTVEGCIGGFVGALITFYIATLNADVAVSKVFGILLVFIACLLAFVGDIFESFLKRQAGIKDSGHIL